MKLQKHWSLFFYLYMFWKHVQQCGASYLFCFCFVFFYFLSDVAVPSNVYFDDQSWCANHTSSSVMFYSVETTSETKICFGGENCETIMISWLWFSFFFRNGAAKLGSAKKKWKEKVRNLKKVRQQGAQLTAAHLVSSILTVGLAVAVPRGWHTPVEAVAAVELGWATSLCHCGWRKGKTHTQKDQNGWVGWLLFHQRGSESSLYSLQVAGSSSVPSPQSSVPSHTHRAATHLPLPHWYCRGPHVSNASVARREGIYAVESVHMPIVLVVMNCQREKVGAEPVCLQLFCFKNLTQAGEWFTAQVLRLYSISGSFLRVVTWYKGASMKPHIRTLSWSGWYTLSIVTVDFFTTKVYSPCYRLTSWRPTDPTTSFYETL